MLLKFHPQRNYAGDACLQSTKINNRTEFKVIINNLSGRFFQNLSFVGCTTYVLVHTVKACRYCLLVAWSVNTCHGNISCLRGRCPLPTCQEYEGSSIQVTWEYEDSSIQATWEGDLPHTWEGDLPHTCSEYDYLMQQMGEQVVREGAAVSVYAVVPWLNNFPQHQKAYHHRSHLRVHLDSPHSIRWLTVITESSQSVYSSWRRQPLLSSTDNTREGCLYGLSSSPS